MSEPTKTYIPFYKRRFLVHPKLQLAVLAYTFFVALVTIVLTSLGSLLLHWTDDPTLTANRGWFLAGGAFCFLLILVSLILAGLILTNRVAGPIHRLETELKAVASGARPTPIHFRKGDLLSDLAEDYNHAVERLNDSRPS